eukprot:TRINITY_DN274_c0_g1_i1.p1 TRINITY_DN274_c0_g1~~TRINITY_DN274_c0_g1_i1.p1  ORF type:complete len:1021 (+),score=263.62 TRINITY_DN274_c0_g1_i1:180-3242(+)
MEKSSFLFFLLVSVLSVLCLSNSLKADDGALHSGVSVRVSLAGGEIHVSPSIRSIPLHSVDTNTHRRTEETPLDQPSLFLLTFNGRVREEVKKSLAASFGVSFLQYHPTNTFLVSMIPFHREDVEKDPAVFSIVEYHPSYKVPVSLHALLDEEGMDSKTLSRLVSHSGLRTESNEDFSVVVSVEFVPGPMNSATILSGLAMEIPVEGVDPVEVSEKMIGVRCRSAEMVQKVVSFMAKRSETIFVSVRQNVYPLNYNGNWILQSGSFEKGRHVWSEGLTGEGEVIGLADTGIDDGHCFFRDLDHPFPYNKVNNEHRKIVYYLDSFADKDDTFRGHGTHVAGSVAGKCIDDSLPMATYNGAAPDAKIAFFDCGKPSSSGLQIPNDMNTYLFGPLYKAGARVFSNSWGGESNTYDSLARNVDEFAYDNPDAIVFFAAGNAGDKPKTIGTPATAKNVIAVGASENAMSTVSAGAAQFGAPLSSNPVVAVPADIVRASPFDGCTDLNNDVDYNGKVAVVERGNCPFVEKVKRCQDKGATSVIVVNNVDGVATMIGDDPSITIPVVMIPRAVGLQLAESKDDFKAISFGGAKFLYLLKSSTEIESVAAFSSRGPTYDGRLKPEICGPGEYVMSSFGNPDVTQSCSLLAMRGTSMASPLVAGHMLLVHQYFKDGYYPSGSKAEEQKMQPSGALMFSLAIAAAVPMANEVHIPNGNEGYGRLLLDKILRFPDDPFPKIAVFDRLSLSTGETKSMCVRAVEPTSIRVVMAWIDPPGGILSDPVLVNNLDIVVVVRDGNKTIGGSVGDDVKHNHEVIDLLSVEKGMTIGIEARGENVPVGPQMFAIVVQGAVEEAACNSDDLTACPGDCGGKGLGKCVDGECVCEGRRYGVLCENIAGTISEGGLIEIGKVVPGEYSYFVVENVKQGSLPLTFRFPKKPSGFVPPVVVGRMNVRPTMDKYDVMVKLSTTDETKVNIPVKEDGKLFVGVYGSCCSSSNFEVGVRDGSFAVSMTMSFWATLLSVAMTFFLFV